MLQKTTAQNKISKLKKRVRIVRGGTSASKTFSIIPFLIDYAVKNPLSEISVVAETIPHLKRGALRDFLKIMEMIGMYDSNNFNKSSLVYVFTNGSYIEFFSADSESKLRGARRDVLFVNECNNISWEAYYQLAIRTRRFIYLDYNPVSEFWVDRELIHDADTDFIILTYKDNEALDLSIVKEIEKAKEKALTSTYWENWWNVYGLGQIGSLQGTIFNNWNQCDAIPEGAEFISYGMDWGFTNDPTTLIECYRYNGELYVNELIYQTGLTNSDIVLKMNELGINRYADIIADSAEPKSIEDVYRGGFKNIYPALKGADSIRNSIDTLQQYTINITKSSTNLIKEFRTWRWAVDKEGKQLGTPIDKDNHAIDALRYIALNKINKSSKIELL
jgi:phage terminase large subunit